MSIFCLGYTPYILKFENQDLTCNQGVENCREVSYYIQLKDCSEKYCPRTLSKDLITGKVISLNDTNLLHFSKTIFRDFDEGK